jgi:hypothetical protein
LPLPDRGAAMTSPRAKLFEWGSAEVGKKAFLSDE